MSGPGGDVVTPELALVDPELAKAQRQIPDRKAAMSSSTPSNGTFFIDPAQPPPASPEVAAVPVSVPEPVTASAESAAPTPAPAHQPASAAPPAEDGSPPMRDVPLGTLIFRAGLLAEEQLEDALQEGMRNGKRLGEVLLERGWLHERDLGRLLAGQKGLPFVEVRGSDAEPSALQLLPEEKARLQITLPLRNEEGQLVVAVADPSNELVLENLRRTLGSEPRLVVAPQSELIRAIGEAYAGFAPEGTALQQEPALPPEPTVQPDPSPQVPTLQREPTLQHEQPATAPAVTPLPAVLPPAEGRDAEPAEAPLLQPLVIEPPAEPVEQVLAVEPVTPPIPLANETSAPFMQPPVIELGAEPVEQPLVVEPVDPPVPMAEETPAPLVAPPAPEPEPTVAVPEAVTPPVPSVEAQPAPAPLMPVAPPQPPVEVVESAPAPEPLLAPPAAQLPVESTPVPVEDVVALTPPAPIEGPVVTAQPEPGPASIHVVLLRLRDGEALEVGTFHTAAEASARAQEVVRQISTAEGDASWPLFADRYIRPDSIMSVEMLLESAEKWLGSAVRTRWAHK